MGKVEMEIIRTVSEMQKLSLDLNTRGRSIGLVPTMGALHKGHLSLIKRSREENDVSIISIFVNPTQFGPREDYKKYPRALEKDKRLAECEGVDIIFTPEVGEMYPEGYLTYVNVEKLSDVLCGAYRPGHFRGVCTVVCKLFNIIRPTRAYFGQKDYQQFKIIKKMTEDLNLNVETIMMPVIRESNGLAVSSRNSYLSITERKQAFILIEALKKAREMIKSEKEANPRRIVSQMRKIIETQSKARIDYIKICHPESLEEIKKIKNKVLVSLAVWIGKTRLIDNIIVRN